MTHLVSKICPLIKFFNLEIPDEITANPATKIGDKSSIIRMFARTGKWEMERTHKDLGLQLLHRHLEVLMKFYWKLSIIDVIRIASNGAVCIPE